MPASSLPITVLAAASTAAADPATAESSALDQAFAALRTYNHGSPRGSLVALDDAVAASLTHPDARSQIEQRLVAALSQELSGVAKEYVARKLSLIGTAQSVPALSALLPSKEVGQAARAALEAMPCAEACAALRESLGRLDGPERIGIIQSLGARQDKLSVAALGALLDADEQTARAATTALGMIATPDALKLLARPVPGRSPGLERSVAEARLVGAEKLLAAGHKAEALAIFKALAEPHQPKLIQLAAQRGLLVSLQRP